MISSFIPLVIFVILDTAYFAFTANKVNKYKQQSTDSDIKDIMNYILMVLGTGIIGFYLLSIDLLNELGFYGDELMYVVLFLSFMASAISLYKSSSIYFNAYAHVGNASIGKKLMFGYIPFFAVPALLLLVLNDSVAELEILLGLVIIGFYTWNFISDTIMDALCYSRLRHAQYQIGSDIAASRDAQNEVKKVWVWKIIVAICSFFLFMGLAIISEYSTLTYFTVLSVGFLYPTSANLQIHRFQLVDKMLKIPLHSLDEIQATEQTTELHVIA
eukprot:NODE_505_length_6682_cov_0.825394.p2 type:complete len:273 gc:universal NODE_505_length_6682_cov_0.825394:4512-5330(+)